MVERYYGPLDGFEMRLGERGDYVRHSDYAALEERLAEKVKVKPLAWRDGKFEAPCIFGLYVVVRHANRFRASLCHTLADGTQSNDVFDEFDYSEDALPRIQADYERRILSALEATLPATHAKSASVEAAPPAPKVTDADMDDAAVAALVALARHNIPTDIQELLVRGDPMRSIPPGALSKSFAAALKALTAAQESGE